MDSKGMDMLSTIIEAFNFTKDGIAIVTLEGTLLYYNRTWLDIHALDPEIDYVGKPLFEVEREEIHPIIVKAKESLLEQGYYIDQIATTRRDGKYHVVQMVVSLIEHLDPQLVVIVLREVTELVQEREELETYRDHLEELVTERTRELSEANELLTKEAEERKRAQLECHELSCRFEMVVDSMPVMLDAFDENGTIVSWNKECERVTGYSSKEIVGNPEALEMLYPDREYREKMLEELDRLEAPIKEWEFELTCKDGSKKTIAWSNVSTEVPIPGWLTWAVGTDVTERIQLEEALRWSEERMRAQFKGIPIPTYTWQMKDEDFTLIGYNDAAVAITEGKIVDCIGAKASEFFVRNPEIVDEMRECYENRSTFRREMYYTLETTGVAHWLDIKYAFVSPDLVIVHTDDVTERKGIEAELERYRAGLEELVDERTQELRKVNKLLRREIVERKNAEESLEKSNRELAVLNEVYKIIATSSDTDEIIGRVLDPVMDFCGAQMGGLFRLDYERNDMELISSSGFGEEIVEQVKYVSMDVKAIKHFITTDGVFVAEEDMPHTDDGKYSGIKRLLGIKKTMAFFIKSHGRMAYLVMLGRMSDDEVPQSVREFMEIIGNQISLAIERLELFDALDKSKTELKKLATRLIGSIEEERRQIALSLHDETSQTLAAAKNDLERLRSHVIGGDEEAERSFQDIKSNLLKIADSTRRISYSLHPAMLEDLGLIPAINWYAEKFVKSKKLQVDVESVGFDSEPPQHVSLTLYRVAQEALSNVVRHADAKHVKIQIAKGYPNVIMVIVDDGKGFSDTDDRKRAKGLGIVGIRERVEGLGGRFRIRSKPGEGTRIRVTIPLEVENDG